MLNPLKGAQLIYKTCDRSLHYAFCEQGTVRLRHLLYRDIYAATNTIEDALVSSLKEPND